MIEALLTLLALCLMTVSFVTWPYDRWFANSCALAAGIVLSLIVGSASADVAVRRAQLYRLELIHESRRVWGLDAPVPTFAAQIHQESGWRPGVCSPFACGLTQFTPSTAEWLHDTYGIELGGERPDRFNPTWAIRALLRYNHHLWLATGGNTECDRMAFVLRKYNGGPKWLARDRAKAKAAGADPGDWQAVEPYNGGRRTDFHKENTEYPKRILIKHQPHYKAWGRTVCGI